MLALRSPRLAPQGTRRVLNHLLVGSALLGLAGCDISGLADLGEGLLAPDRSLLDSPGRQIAQGDYSNLTIDGSLDSGGHVVAMRWDKESSRVSIFPYPEGEGCEVEPAVDFWRVSSRIDVNAKPLLAVQRNSTSAGRGTISFVDFSCKEVLPSIQDAPLPKSRFPSEVPRGLLTLNGQGDLILVNPLDVDLETIATGVSDYSVRSDRLFTIEGTELVIRDADLEVSARVGNEVTKYRTGAGDVIPLAFEDSSGVSIWNESEGEVLLSDDACGLQNIGSNAIAFYSPCESRRLNIHVAGDKVGLTERVTLLGPEGTIRLSSVISSFGLDFGHTDLLFVSSADPDARLGTLLHAELPIAPESADDIVLLDPLPLADVAYLNGGEIYLEWDGEKGKLVDLRRSDSGHVEGLIEVAQGVALLPGGSPYAATGALTSFTDGSGELTRLSRSGNEITAATLAKRVPKQPIYSEPETGLLTFIADVNDSGVGTLMTVSGDKSSDVGTDALVETATFLEQPRAIIYLARPNAGGSSELRAYLLDPGLTSVINENVREYRSLPWPSPGVLYSVPDGDEAGIWFSKAR